jgi:hypothetical protein
MREKRMLFSAPDTIFLQNLALENEFIGIKKSSILELKVIVKKELIFA